MAAKEEQNDTLMSSHTFLRLQRRDLLVCRLLKRFNFEIVGLLGLNSGSGVDCFCAWAVCTGCSFLVGVLLPQNLNILTK